MDKRTEGKPVIIASNGHMTYIFFEGNVYGDKIERVEFTHDAPELPAVEIKAEEYPVSPIKMESEKFTGFLKGIMKGK